MKNKEWRSLVLTNGDNVRDRRPADFDVPEKFSKDVKYKLFAFKFLSRLSERKKYSAMVYCFI